MVHTYTPTYYSTIHGSISSICKNILPFSLKKRKLPAIAAAEKKFSEQQSDHLKWQQESFHQILKLIGLCKEGIVPETEVSTFRADLLQTLVASPLDYEQPAILRDKIIFLQELLYANCISDDEYHSSKRPLLQRLAVQGGEIDAKNVIVKDCSNEGEWSDIDLNNDKCLVGSKGVSSSKQIRGAASSVLGFITPSKTGKVGVEKGGNETKSILMTESLSSKIDKVEVHESGGCRAKKNPFRTLFPREQKGEERGQSDDTHYSEGKSGKSGKKQQWLFKKWKKNDCDENETAPLPLGGERSDDENLHPNLFIPKDKKDIS